MIEDAKTMSTPEPAPTAGSGPALWPLVITDIELQPKYASLFTVEIRDRVVIDMRDRDASGRAKYGTPLKPLNGRDALVDAYQEALDFVVYLRQALWEAEAENTVFLSGVPAPPPGLDLELRAHYEAAVLAVFALRQTIEKRRR